MEKYSSETDVLSLRTTNINVRISPILKAKIIEQGAAMGINISDYINYILTKAMSRQNEVETPPQYKQLLAAYQETQRQLKAAKEELALYETVTEPLKQNVGKIIRIEGQPYKPQHVTELITMILKTFKFKP